MTTLDLPDLMVWTPEALERLPAEYRYEVSEGKLVVMSAAMRPWHAEVQRRVCNLLVGQGRHAYIEQGVVLPDNEIRTCDVGVFADPPTGGAYHPAEAFELLVEVVSDSSRREDREIKPRIYAGAGVPEYWRVEEDTAGGAIVYQFRVAHLADGPSMYAESRVVTLAALESE